MIQFVLQLKKNRLVLQLKRTLTVDPVCASVKEEPPCPTVKEDSTVDPVCASVKEVNRTSKLIAVVLLKKLFLLSKRKLETIRSFCETRNHLILLLKDFTLSTFLQQEADIYL